MYKELGNGENFSMAANKVGIRHQSTEELALALEMPRKGLGREGGLEGKKLKA